MTDYSSRVRPQMETLNNVEPIYIKLSVIYDQ